MAVEERRRVALHRAAADSWGEEVADTLVELVAPSGHELATREDVRVILDAMDAMERRWDARFAAQDERLSAMDDRWHERLSAMDERWHERLSAMDQQWDIRFEGAEDRSVGRFHEAMALFERRIADAVTHQTRTLVFSQLAAIVLIAGLAFGLR